MDASQTCGLHRLLDMDPMIRTYERLRRQLSTRLPVDSVWDGFLDVLDGLPADARVALLLSDIFEASIDEVAALLHRDAAACRKLVDHARAHVQAAGPRRAGQ
jgi:RNA polymerase sigma-70 factor (ECF subfamily)